MTLNNFINYVYKNQNRGQNSNDKNDKNDKNQNVELEIRFGKYSNVSSNINIKTFTQILQLRGVRKYTLIKERILDSDVKERYIYKHNDIKSLFSKLKTYITKTPEELESAVKSTISSTIKTQPVEKHFMVKDRIKKPISGVNYKIALLSETITSHNPESQKSQKSQKSQISRYKLRCNWLDKMWMYDVPSYFIAMKKIQIYVEFISKLR